MFLRSLAYTALLFFSFSLAAQPLPGVDYLSTLKRAAAYSEKWQDGFPGFSYQSSNEPALQELRKRFKLDSVAGFGNEASRLINLLHWVHNTVRHDGQHESGIREITAAAIVAAAKERGVGVSCGELATTLNDCYLAMGWPSRKVYCFPKDSLKIDRDSHVINAVYLTSQKKWVWMDPTNDAYVTDERGNLLGIEEVRARLIADQPLLVNLDANWNHRSSAEKPYYLDVYMAKNLYRFYSPLESRYDYETRGQGKRVVYAYLYPLDYAGTVKATEDYDSPTVKTGFKTYNLFNAKQFWQPPVE